MTKEERIQEAYGLAVWNFLDDSVKEKILSNDGGWTYEVNEKWLENSMNLDIELNGKYCRPKSLKGIENNNGWIKIESEEDLPKESGVYEACINEEYIGRIRFSREFNEWSCIYDSDNLRFPSHYQPIIKPQPPIY